MPFRKAIATALLLISFSCIRSQNEHQFKLTEGKTLFEETATLDGNVVWKAYERTFQEVEDGDTLVHVERYRVNRYWRLNHYILENGRPRLFGWQQEFDTDGNLSMEHLCAKRKRCPDTRSFVYYPSGQLMSVTGFRNDKRHGSHILFYPNGQLRQHIVFSLGKMQEVLAYYDEEGHPLDQGSLCEGEGHVNVYAMNGQLIKRKFFRKGKETGETLVND
jgi:hypothetical protein